MKFPCIGFVVMSLLATVTSLLLIYLGLSHSAPQIMNIGWGMLISWWMFYEVFFILVPMLEEG